MDAHQPKTVAVSGGFDPIHIGHVRMFEKARKLGDRLVVILNNDNWLRAKKGFAFMPQEERAEIIKSFPFVDDVYITEHIDSDPDESASRRSVARELTSIKPDIFANGGDRDEKNATDPNSSLYWDIKACKENGIEMIFGVGKGGKVQSSSWLINAIKDIGKEVRPWGQFRVLDAGAGYWIKTIIVEPGHRLSLQSHKNRSEIWVCVRGEITAECGEMQDGKAIITEVQALHVGDHFFVPAGVVHRLSSKTGGTVAEIAIGQPTEQDIERFEDDYNRT